VVSIDLGFKGTGTGRLPESSIDGDKRRIELHKRKEGHICIIVLGLCETSVFARGTTTLAQFISIRAIWYPILARNYERSVKEHLEGTTRRLRNAMFAQSSGIGCPRTSRNVQLLTFNVELCRREDDIFEKRTSRKPDSSYRSRYS